MRFVLMVKFSLLWDCLWDFHQIVSSSWSLSASIFRRSVGACCVKNRFGEDCQGSKLFENQMQLKRREDCFENFLAFVVTLQTVNSVLCQVVGRGSQWDSLWGKCSFCEMSRLQSGVWKSYRCGPPRSCPHRGARTGPHSTIHWAWQWRAPSITVCNVSQGSQPISLPDVLHRFLWPMYGVSIPFGEGLWGSGRGKEFHQVKLINAPVLWALAKQTEHMSVT